MIYLIIGFLGLSIILFFRASLFYGQMATLYKQKVQLKDVFAYKLFRITFAITLLLSLANVII